VSVLDFDLDDTITLLLGRRKEEFPHEREIRLFQFQTWIWYPAESLHAPNHAGRLAAAALLRNIETKRFPSMGRGTITLQKLQSLAKLDEYHLIFDAIIAPRGGWSSTILHAIWPVAFDKRIRERTLHGKMVADLIEYRLRFVVNNLTPVQGSNISHAVFFKWRSNKKVTARTIIQWWSRLKRSAVFVYLIEEHGFAMRPPVVDDDQFLKNLLKPKISKMQLKKFFSMYAYASEKIADEAFIAKIPERLKRTQFDMPIFSADELAAIAAYESESKGMNDKKSDWTDEAD
jgi:hypothetical protein